ncbi:hypothetical protein X798_01769 [Onchocerca flexuosa]|uniref:DDE Tnp4 domain-containing protein n=2 Tax=Onchocerca flexuosa TaxID=387005 RepID=A0A183GZS1_9BILA|nr:hypothetical protein X798_01769 [Onchocerca flexuosa]VDO26861.1 unnamed protein product [Onchocerca flexuosa]
MRHPLLERCRNEMKPKRSLILSYIELVSEDGNEGEDISPIEGASFLQLDPTLSNSICKTKMKCPTDAVAQDTVKLSDVTLNRNIKFHLLQELVVFDGQYHSFFEGHSKCMMKMKCGDKIALVDIAVAIRPGISRKEGTPTERSIDRGQSFCAFIQNLFKVM